jgi:hypothetical protein
MREIVSDGGGIEGERGRVSEREGEGDEEVEVLKVERGKVGR